MNFGHHNADWLCARGGLIGAGVLAVLFLLAVACTALFGG